MDLLTLVGSLGVALITIAFILNQFHKWQQDYLIYDLTNLVGGILLYVYASNIKSYPFIVFSIVWALVSFKDFMADLYKNYKNENRGFVNKWLK